MAEDILTARGPLDSMSAGTLTPEDQAYVLTASRERLTTGWPTWHERYADPIDPPYDDVLDWSGSALIYDLNPVAIHPHKGPFVLGLKGHIDNLVSEHRGTFEDFALFEWDEAGNYLGDDPVGAHVLADNAGATSGVGNAVSAWTRHYRVFYPPKNARYIVPKVVTGSIGAGKGLYLDAFQMEMLDVNDPATPTTWVPPRHIQVRVRPTRLNYSTNPSFTVSAANLTTAGPVTLTRDTTKSYQGQAALKVEIGTASAPARVREDSAVEITEGEWLAVSFRTSVEATLACTYQARIVWMTKAGTPVDVVSGGAIHQSTGNNWDLQSVVARAPAGTDEAYVDLVYSGSAPSSDDAFWLDAVLIEKASQVGEYFDGASGADYLWQQNGIPGLTRSYYYQDRVKRHYILERTLRENVPIGVSIAEPEYAKGGAFPSLFGFGDFGSGPFGG